MTPRQQRQIQTLKVYGTLCINLSTSLEFAEETKQDLHLWLWRGPTIIRGDWNVISDDSAKKANLILQESNKARVLGPGGRAAPLLARVEKIVAFKKGAL